MMLDVTNVKTFLRLNGLSEASPESEIRNLLSAAHYSDTEITAFLAAMRDPDASWVPPRTTADETQPLREQAIAQILEQAQPAPVRTPSPAHPAPAAPPAPNEPEYTVPTYKLAKADPLEAVAVSVHAEQVMRRFQGRISRENFALGMVALFGACIVALVLAEMLRQVPFLMYLACVPIAAAAAVLGISLSMRRLHDLGHPGSMVAIMIVPYVNLLFLLYLLIKKGEPQENAYGKTAQEAPFLRALLANA